VCPYTLRSTPPRNTPLHNPAGRSYALRPAGAFPPIPYADATKSAAVSDTLLHLHHI